LNLYAYVRNNPLSGVDFDGHEVNSTNPCNGASNCTAQTTLVSTSTKYNPKTDATTVTTVNNVVATTNNADGTSTRVSANVTSSVTINDDGKPVSATESQSSTLVENFSKANGQGGSTIGFTGPVESHSVATGQAVAMVGRLGMEDAGMEKAFYKMAELHGYDRYTGKELSKTGERLEDANTILEGIKEAVDPK
jgi:hypothetical protein